MRNWIKIWTVDFSDKLKGRANKRLSDKTFIPIEYTEYTWIIEEAYYFKNLWYTIEEILFSIISNLTKNIDNKYLDEELESWHIKPNRVISDLIIYELDGTWDILGWVYQSLLTEWEKNIKWSYYTPTNIVKESIDKYFIDWMNFIDPCCWTWQFLLQINSTDPTKIRWADLDYLAVKIARINLMIKYSWIDFEPNIFHIDSLKKSNWLFDIWKMPVDYFDLVATNPPRWAKIDSTYDWYSIKSWESFSYFIERGMELLKENGVLSYILPESILNVKVHKDIRWFLLWYNILAIHELGRIFTWVFTPAIKLDVKKNREDWKIKIYSKESYWIDKSLFNNNQDFTFSIHINSESSDLLDKVYSKKSIFLNNENSEWALWIVTWENKKFISDKQLDWFVPVYTGKEVKPFLLDEPKKYLYYAPEKYQQMAPISRYQTKPKLIYKFISKKLVFSYDMEWVYTLNSANILIPKIDYSLKVMTALFNSELYQHIFQKKFNSIKVLKSHIQELPLPIFRQNEIANIEKYVDDIINKKQLDNKKILDEYIFNLLTK